MANLALSRADHERGLSRIRADYERADRAAVWTLLVVAVLVLVARHIAPWILVGRLDEQLLTGGDILAAMPVLLAAAAVLAVPQRRPIVLGSLLLAAAAVLQVIGHLSPLYGGETAVLDMLGLAAAMLVVAGPLLIGHGLGGVHSRPGVALLLAGLAISLLAAVCVAGQSLPLMDEGLSPLSFVSSLVGQFMYVAWAYLLAAAIERGDRLLAVGSGLLLAANLLGLLLGEAGGALAPAPVVPLASEVLLLANFVGWAALIAGMLFEADKAAAEVSRR